MAEPRYTKTLRDLETYVSTEADNGRLSRQIANAVISAAETAALQFEAAVPSEAVTPLDPERLARALRRAALPDASPWEDALPENRAGWLSKAAPLIRADAADRASLPTDRPTEDAS